MKGLRKKLLYLLSILFISMGMQAQSLDQAKKLYNDGQYAEAKPAFEKLVKTSPNNSSYNLWYGICCYETGNLQDAQKHLEFAAKKKASEAYGYLARLYYKIYRFNDAVDMFNEYIAYLEKKKKDTTEWNAQLELAEKAARMMNNTENVQIIDSLVVDKNDFLSAYQLSEESGSLVPYRKFFNTDQPVESVVYMNEKKDKVYYAHPTEDNRFCLYTQSKLMDSWGDEKQLPMTINSNEDDNYPFVLSDGVTIYYASKGNGSIGGYDLFITRYNTNSDTYLTPEQMGMPFNSPYNDYMMVVDEAKGLGWFVTDRFQPEGQVVVYLFIPNPERLDINTEEEEIKRNRAIISSIQESWKEGSDYKTLIQLAHTQLSSGNEEIKKDFNFVITDDVVYYTLEDIKSPEARSYYEKVIASRNQLNALNEKLENMRIDYTQANQGGKDKLKAAILQAEEKIADLQSQPGEWEVKARNAEIRFLRNKR
ncbi:tetratricopeptide repeat protein [Parabacteroides pacaensis]|uniref:tetratricopeptide repeat protein n=1 Tax=Parabacteroides pacaensis TaxID=2086575 RepID=UPI000D0F5A1B|nr:tetratricopeptide repeat protein [Parabacteroides pacaensis]